MSCYRNKMIGLIFSLFCLFLGSSECRADLVWYSYEGASLQFAEGPLLASEDSISGMIGFDAIGSQFARSISLAVLDRLSNTRLRMEVTDTSKVGGITIPTNFFKWQSQSIPIEFELTMVGNVFNEVGDEQISIGDYGDLALVEIGLPTESSAYNFRAGKFSAIPEPNSLLLSLVSSTLILFFRNVWSVRFYGG